MRYRKFAVVTAAVWILALLTIAQIQAQDTQWRGANRDGKYPDSGLLKSWPESGPELILKKDDLGNGYSSPIVYEGMIYISGRRQEEDVITKLDLQGNILWETVYGKAWNRSFPETRSTPTIEDGRIYIMGGLGTIVCMDTEKGEILWQVNTHEEHGGEFHRWGMTESLLLTGSVVISSPTGEQTAVVALDKKDGSLLWKSKPQGGVRSYVSPMLIEHNGTRMVLITSSEDFLAVDPETGEVFWSIDLVMEYGFDGRRNNTNTPLFHNGEIFTTSGYDASAVMIKLSKDGKDAEVKWSNDVLDTHHGGVVLLDGFIYGSNWLNNGNGNWVCLEWESGKVMYEEKWFNKGSIIYADGLLYIFEEKNGNIGLLEPSPEGFELISSFLPEGGTGPWWAHMTIYEKKLFVRHGATLFVYDIEKS
ncbi:MAG: PQQ-binding-like beta-propeller repeat protein [Bacteroidales bacterium]|nr:PQQ-binding-like beta-propeller repeat protein [Bacteroidales bacterium]